MSLRLLSHDEVDHLQKQLIIVGPTVAEFGEVLLDGLSLLELSILRAWEY